jgi:hypothetical protein
MKASARDPAHRFQNADEFIAALEAWEKTGSAVALPPAESIEAVVAATVPRASGGGGTDPTLSSNTASGRGQPVGSNTGSGAAHVDPTVNTWSNASIARAPQKSAAPVVIATAIGVLLLAGAATGAYLFLKAPAQAAGPLPSATALAAAVHPAETAAPSAAPREEASVAPQPEKGVPEIAPVAASAGAATVETSQAQAQRQPPSNHHRAQEKPPEKQSKPEQPKSKPAINFGY